MDCSSCGHRWCWICGFSLENKYHELMAVPCHLMNLASLLKLPSCLKVCLLPIILFIGMPFILLFGFTFVIGTLLKDWLISHKEWISDNFEWDWSTFKMYTKFIVFILFILPLLIITFILTITFGIVGMVVFVAPCYIVSIFSFGSMISWWCRNKKVESKLIQN